MDKFLIKKPTSIGSSSTPNVAAISETNPSSKRPRIEFSEDDIVTDLGLHKPIEEYDVGIRDRVRREYLLKGPCQPFGHDFPKKQYGNTMRGCRELWFKNNVWLEYSVSKDKVYCLWCYLFRQARGGKSGGDVFTSMGFSNWKKAVEVFHEHIGDCNSAHNIARGKCEAFKDQRQSVSHVLSLYGSDEEKAYRIRLTAILDCIRHLLVQGLAFRGHDESESSLRKGNFLELLEWYSLRKKKVRRTLGHNAPGNNQMTSPKTQKELVSACAAETTLAIIKDIGDSFISLMVDESRDNSVKEQMAVVLRYVNKHGQVIERFIGVEHVTDTCSQNLKNAIDKLFASHRFSISKLRGQGYDGASNMRGEFNGLKSLILRDNPSATYIHCFAHQLQLAVVAIAKNNFQIGDFFNYTSLIVTMVGASCKRKDNFGKVNIRR